MVRKWPDSLRNRQLPRQCAFRRRTNSSLHGVFSQRSRHYVLLIENAPSFVAPRKSKTVNIEVTFYQEGSQMLEFNAEALNRCSFGNQKSPLRESDGS